MNLSREAKSALINTAPRAGAKVNANPQVLGDLLAAGLIRNQGLTRKGVIVRERVFSEALEVF